MRFFVFMITMYLRCGPRQLFFFQCGVEMPKGRTPLITCSEYFNTIMVCHFLILTENIICLLIIDREGRRRRGEKHLCDREIAISYLPYMSQPSTGGSKTQVFAQTGDQACKLLAYRMMLQPTEPPSQGSITLFLMQSFLNTSKNTLHLI